MPKAESAMEFRRRRAVELMQQGEPKKTISRILGVSTTSLNVWMQKLKAGESLRTKLGHGRPRRLSDGQLQELRELLAKGPTAHGWEDNFWTCSRVRDVIQRHIGINYCPSGAWHVLHDYLDWSCIRPAKESKKRDNAEIERWKIEGFPQIEQVACRRGAYLAFVDESGFMMTPTIRRTFAPRGSTPVNRISDPHGRISTIAAIVVSPKRKRLDIHYRLLADNTNFRGPGVVEFLRQLHGEIGGPITIVWDRIVIHWAEVVLEYLETAPQIQTEFFPPYAPELNPVDRAWFYLKYDRFPNYTPLTLGELRNRVESELQRLRTQPNLLRSFIRRSGVPIVV